MMACLISSYVAHCDAVSTAARACSQTEDISTSVPVLSVKAHCSLTSFAGDPLADAGM